MCYVAIKNVAYKGYDNCKLVSPLLYRTHFINVIIRFAILGFIFIVLFITVLVKILCLVKSSVWGRIVDDSKSSTTDSSFGDYPPPDDSTRRTAHIAGFQPFTKYRLTMLKRNTMQDFSRIHVAWWNGKIPNKCCSLNALRARNLSI